MDSDDDREDYVHTKRAKLKDMNPFEGFAKLKGPTSEFILQKLYVTLGRTTMAHKLSQTHMRSKYNQIGVKRVDVDLGEMKNISKHHASIIFNFKQKKYELIVFGKNGAIVNNIFFPPDKTRRIPLENGTELQFGDSFFVFFLPYATDTPRVSAFRKLNSKTVIVGEENDQQASKSAATTSEKSKKYDGKKQKSESDKKKAPQLPKPTQSYATMIGEALQCAPNKQLMVHEIYDYIMEHYPYYKTCEIGWRSSVRHNLAMSKFFRKAPVPEGANTSNKKNYYQLNAEYEKDQLLLGSGFQKEQQQQQKDKETEKDKQAAPNSAASSSTPAPTTKKTKKAPTSKKRKAEKPVPAKPPKAKMSKKEKEAQKSAAKEDEKPNEPPSTETSVVPAQQQESEIVSSTVAASVDVQVSATTPIVANTQIPAVEKITTKKKKPQTPKQSPTIPIQKPQQISPKTPAPLQTQNVIVVAPQYLPSQFQQPTIQQNVVVVAPAPSPLPKLQPQPQPTILMGQLQQQQQPQIQPQQPQIPSALSQQLLKSLSPQLMNLFLQQIHKQPPQAQAQSFVQNIQNLQNIQNYLIEQQQTQPQLVPQPQIFQTGQLPTQQQLPQAFQQQQQLPQVFQPQQQITQQLLPQQQPQVFQPTQQQPQPQSFPNIQFQSMQRGHLQ